MKPEAFKIPDSFLRQLEEFTTGFYLISINERGEFNTHSYYPSPAAAMALFNFIDIEADALQENLRLRALERINEDDEDSEDDED